MGVFVGEVHRLAADAAHRLGGEDLLFVSLKGQAVGAVVVGTVAGGGHGRGPLS